MSHQVRKLELRCALLYFALLRVALLCVILLCCVLLCSALRCSVDGVGEWMGESCDCFVGNGARYWRLICGIIGMFEEIKSPCQCRGL